MPNVIQPAPTGRAKCRGCGQAIAAGELRFGESLPNPFADGEMTHWFHLACAAYKRPEPFLQTVEARGEPLDDRERLVAEARLGLAHRRLPRVSGVERSPSGRAQCRACRTSIEKNAWRISLVFYEEGQFSPSGFIHVPCARAYLEATDAEMLPRLRHFARGLVDDDLSEVEAELRRPAAAP
ncbi:MAG TPA: hypothetical protein VFM88_13890 [Vicinamibacteria bacterium]|nr:hypothetical protein [Vicinamibacteria bacterium]